MADDTKGTTTDSKLNLGDLKKMVADTVAEAMKNVTTTGSNTREVTQSHLEGRGDRSSTVQAAVAAEIQKIKDSEQADKDKAAREAKDQEFETKLSKLSEATAEKPPVERRRVHKFMGWGE